MAAPKGNQFWRIRSKHGRDKIFADPKLLLESAFEYFEWCENNPLIEIDFKGKDAKRVEMPKMRAYTMGGLCVYIGCNTSFFRNFKLRLEKEKSKESEDFLAVITHIEDIAYNQKFVGAAANLLNANIIARDLGLIDKTDLTTKGQAIENLPRQINIYNSAPPLASDESEIDA